MPKVTISPNLRKILRDKTARKAVSDMVEGQTITVYVEGEYYTVSLGGPEQEHEIKPWKKLYTCPTCGQSCDGDRAHALPNGSMCNTVLGRRGWRQLGDYDS